VGEKVRFGGSEYIHSIEMLPERITHRTVAVAGERIAFQSQNE
jgi:hypothetical protein